MSTTDCGRDNAFLVGYTCMPLCCVMSCCALSGYFGAAAMRVTGVGAAGAAVGAALLGCLLSVLLVRVVKPNPYIGFPWEVNWSSKC